MKRDAYKKIKDVPTVLREYAKEANKAGFFSTPEDVVIHLDRSPGWWESDRGQFVKVRRADLDCVYVCRLKALRKRVSRTGRVKYELPFGPARQRAFDDQTIFTAAQWLDAARGAKKYAAMSDDEFWSAETDRKRKV